MVGEIGLSRRIKVSWEESCPVPSCCGIPHYLGTLFVLVFPLQALNNWRALGLWILARLLAFQLYLLCSSFLPSGSWWLRALARGGRASYPISLFFGILDNSTLWSIPESIPKGQRFFFSGSLLHFLLASFVNGKSLLPWDFASFYITLTESYQCSEEYHCRNSIDAYVILRNKIK